MHVGFSLKTLATFTFLTAAWLIVYGQPAQGEVPYSFLAAEPAPLPIDSPHGHSIYQQAQVDEILNYAPLQEARQQQVEPLEFEPEIQAVQYPFEPSGGVDLPTEPPPFSLPPTQPTRPAQPTGPTGLLTQSSGRSQWSKRVLQTTVLPGSGDALGMLEIDSRATTFFSQWPMLRLTPRFAIRSLDGPVTTDLPPALFDFSLGLLLYLPVSETWTFMGEVSPGVYSDFESYSSQSLRIPGRAIAIYLWNEQLQLMGGLIYFDRRDIGLFPAAGLIYSPNADVKMELTFPKPKFSWRYLNDPGRQRTVYLAGELWGGSWTVRRAANVNDTVTLSDLRLLVGWEHREGEHQHWSLEAGYVFNRQLEYTSGLGDMDLNNTALLRFTLGY